MKPSTIIIVVGTGLQILASACATTTTTPVSVTHTTGAGCFTNETYCEKSTDCCSSNCVQPEPELIVGTGEPTGTCEQR